MVKINFITLHNKNIQLLFIGIFKLNNGMLPTSEAKASPRPLYNFGKWPKTAIACKKFFKKQDILEEDYQKASKRVTLCFLSNPVPFNRQNYQKQIGAWN